MNNVCERMHTVCIQFTLDYFYLTTPNIKQPSMQKKVSTGGMEKKKGRKGMIWVLGCG